MRYDTCPLHFVKHDLYIEIYYSVFSNTLNKSKCYKTFTTPSGDRNAPLVQFLWRSLKIHCTTGDTQMTKSKDRQYNS